MDRDGEKTIWQFDNLVISQLANVPMILITLVVTHRSTPHYQIIKLTNYQIASIFAANHSQ